MDAALAAVPELTDDDRRKLHNCELLLATFWPPAVAAGTAAQDKTVWHAMSTRQSSCLEGHNQPLHQLMFSCSPSLLPADFLHTCHFLAVAQEMRESVQAQAQQAQQAAGGQQGAA